jgi:hypothetical protein
VPALLLLVWIAQRGTIGSDTPLLASNRP